MGLFLSAVAAGANVVQEDSIAQKMAVHGTVRGKYEYQLETGEGRFQVRNARVCLEGTVAKLVGYKAEIDLSDQGQLRMLDAFVRVKPVKDFTFDVGQMRVPFSIDAHRSPHLQYFANRSFIAKQVGDVRDVGAMAGYNWKAAGLRVEAGLFNGAGITEQKQWHKHLNYSAKVQWCFHPKWNLTLSTQTVCPDSVRINLYTAGMYYEDKHWHVEGEYLYKKYEGKAYHDVHSVDAFVSYGIPLKRAFRRMSFVGRWDYMNNHSDGKTLLPAVAGQDRQLKTTDYARQRITGGITLGLGLPLAADIRLNYEKYFYHHDGIPKSGERDKLVIEFMAHF